MRFNTAGIARAREGELAKQSDDADVALSQGLRPLLDEICRAQDPVAQLPLNAHKHTWTDGQQYPFDASSARSGCKPASATLLALPRTVRTAQPAAQSHVSLSARMTRCTVHGALPRFCGGGLAPDLKDLIAGICLSVLGDEGQVKELFEQEWVDTWQGWAELAVDGRDAVAMAVAERFLRLAGANAPVHMTSNRERLRQLEEEGLVLQVAHSHGVNNCLIDALLLGLVLAGIAPQTYSVDERARLCAMCRSDLLEEHGTPRGIYLDGHRDAPRILTFFLQKLWAADVSVRVYFHDCLDQRELGEVADELAYVDFTWGTGLIYERHILHVYNHIDPTGQGYHFDALIRKAPPSDTAHSEAAPKRVKSRPDPTPEEPSEQPSSLARHNVARVQQILGDFFRRRGASVTITRHDAAEVVAAWYDHEALTTKLHTVLQAGLVHADSGMHAAYRLAEQWRAYWTVRSQGPGQVLGQQQPTTISSTEASKKRCRETETTPASTEQERTAAVTPHNPVPAAAATEAETRNMRHSVPGRKRLRGKQSPPAAWTSAGQHSKEKAVHATELEAEATEMGSDEFVLRAWSPADGNQDPRARVDAAVAALGRLYRCHPTLPAWLDPATAWPFDTEPFCCAFADCTFEAETVAALQQHTVATHHRALESVVAMFPRRSPVEEVRMDAYRAGLTWVCQQRAHWPTQPSTAAPCDSSVMRTAATGSAPLCVFSAVAAFRTRKAWAQATVFDGTRLSDPVRKIFFRCLGQRQRAR